MMLFRPLLGVLAFAACGSVVDNTQGAPDAAVDSALPDAPAARCGDGVLDDEETDIDCGGSQCPRCTGAQRCTVDADCDADSCDAGQCTPALSCADLHTRAPGAPDGVYVIQPAGAAAAFRARCDMTREAGGWTLLLKANGTAALEFGAAAWTDDALIAADDLSLDPGNAKYPAFVSLPVTTLRGELDGYLYSLAIAEQTARAAFAGPAMTVTPYPSFNDSGALWSTQAFCREFGINPPYNYAHVRFGWIANQEDDCTSTDTAIGLGINYNVANGVTRGAGYVCQSDGCTRGAVNEGGNGLLWGR